MRALTALTLPVLAVLAAASAGIVSSTLLAGQAMRSLADQSLEGTAIGISRAATQMLRAEGEQGVDFRGLFADRVVAYALLAAPDATLLFHTNPDLSGAPFDDPPALALLTRGGSVGRRAVL